MEQPTGLKLSAVSLNTEIPNEMFEALLAYVEPNKARQLKQIKRKTAQLSLVGILLAKHLIHQKWKLPLKEIQFGEGSHGKPFVIGHKDLYFNISHSGSMCVCAVDDTPVGIDIQKMEQRRYSAIANRFFTLEEQQAFRNQGCDLQSFYRIWTQRESVGKYLGNGFHYKPQDDTKDWQVNHTMHQNEYMLCVCTKKRNDTKFV